MNPLNRILDGINSPDDLKNLGTGQMEQLAQEIRACLLDSVAQCGGHLAANLGVVELTISLHRVFDTRRDRLVWDVGHQSYAHKIITGRREQMSTLRQFGGISGFPKVEESEHDAFNTGHSSTSISAALGMALARDIQGLDYQVIAVIGDGALTGGMAFEAMDHAGHVGCDMMVILNDNEMSINKNVGAMSSYLNRMRTGAFYNRAKARTIQRLNRIPGIGPEISRAAGFIKDMVKHLMVAGQLFEELGFTYIGPVNGHDIEEMLTVFKNARNMKGPVMVHVLTSKGQGYDPAFAQPDIFHGVGPFDLETGLQPKKALKSYTDIFGEYIMDKARRDPRIVAITAAMTGGTGLNSFAETFPERFFDVGICEQHAVTLAAGMARQGLKPVVCLYSSFLQRAYDQLIHDVALQRLPVVIAIDRAGLVGDDGPTHHGVFDLAFMRSIPGFTIMAPGSEDELPDMFETAFDLDGPVAIRYPRGAGNGCKVKDKPGRLEYGKAQVISEGRDLAILAIGRGVELALETAALLGEKGVNAAVVNMRFLKPLDEALLLRMAARSPRLVIVEEGTALGGLGSAVLESLAARGVKAEVEVMAVPDNFVEQGNINRLFELIGLDSASLRGRILDRWPQLGKIVIEQTNVS